MRLLLFTLILAFTAESPGQIRPKIKQSPRNSLMELDAGRTPTQVAPVQQLFAAVERGLLARDVTIFSRYLGKQVSLTLSGGDGGFVSTSQAVSILENFLSTRKPTQFAFTRWNDTTANPYATGRMTLMHRGSMESAQVYVSLSLQDGEWVISRLNIY